MEDGLVQAKVDNPEPEPEVLILIVVEDGLVQSHTETEHTAQQS